MDKIIKRDNLKDNEKHKIESPHYAVREVEQALSGTRFQKLWGIENFIAEHKNQLAGSSTSRESTLAHILRSQTWYLVLDRPVSPLFHPSDSNSVARGVNFGPFKTKQTTTANSPTKFSDLEYTEYNFVKDGLTIYLGGAGMDGEYIQSQVAHLRTAGIRGAIAGKLSEGTIADAAAVIKYRDPVRSISGLSATGPFKINANWSLGAIGVYQELPKNGQFNLIGYSWGSLVAAQTALFYAENGQTIDNLVLIGSPISKDFLRTLRATHKIKRILVIDLTHRNDKIYAGMTDTELMASLPSLGEQMMSSQTSSSGQGHFFYGIAGEEGEARRLRLAERLRREGLE